MVDSKENDKFDLGVKELSGCDHPWLSPNCLFVLSSPMLGGHIKWNHPNKTKNNL